LGNCKNAKIDNIYLNIQGGTMPEFETISVEEAKLMAATGRRGKTLQEYAHYIQQLSEGQAGKLHLLEQENPTSIRKGLVLAAQALGITLGIKRSGQDVYFWVEAQPEPPAAERPRRRGRRPRIQEEPAPAEPSQTWPEEPLPAPEVPSSETASDMVAQREPTS
jgi:hypothetical protein